MILAASPAYLERRVAPRTLRELAEHDCLTISNRQGRNSWRLQGPRGSQEVSINSRFAVNDMRVLAQACIAGLGIALLPQLIVEPIIAKGQLVRVLPTYRRASTGLGLQLVYTSRPPVPPAVAAFAEFLSEKLGEAMANPSQNHAGDMFITSSWTGERRSRSTVEQILAGSCPRYDDKNRGRNVLLGEADLGCLPQPLVEQPLLAGCSLMRSAEITRSIRSACSASHRFP